LTRPAACSELRRLPRRELLRLGGLGLFGLGLSDLFRGSLAAAAPAASFGRAKRCLLLFMWGGPSQLETWDMKPDAPAEVRGEFSPIATKVPGIQICEHFPQLAQRTDKLAIIRSMTHGDVNHTSATHFLLTGHPPPPTADKRLETPHYGAVLAKLGRDSGVLPPLVQMRPKLDNDVPRFVEQSQGQGGGWLGPVFDPLTIDHAPDRADYTVGDLVLRPELSIERLTERLDLRARLNEQIQLRTPLLQAQDESVRRAFELLTSSVESQNVFDLAAEPVEVRERYGMNPHGQSVLQARRLLEHGVPLVTIFWPNDGIKNVSVYWDTHSRNFIDHKSRLMPVADQAFSALLDDLQQRGLLDDTLIVWTGEFGRTPKIGQRNSDAGAGRDGRDHWPNCFSSVLAGAGVPGGQVYGRSDRHAAYPADNPVTPGELAATVYHLLGVPQSQIVHDVAGRPHYIRPASPIEALLG
jgi:hypothetical protein